MASQSAPPYSPEVLRAGLTRAALEAFHQRLIPIRYGASHRYEVTARGARWEVEGPRCQPLAIQTRDGWRRVAACPVWPCPHFGATLLPHGYRATDSRGQSLAFLPFGEECPTTHFNHSCYFCWFALPHTFGEHAVEVACYQARAITDAMSAHNPWLAHVTEGLTPEVEASHRLAARLAISAVEEAA